MHHFLVHSIVVPEASHDGGYKTKSFNVIEKPVKILASKLLYQTVTFCGKEMCYDALNNTEKKHCSYS